MKQTLKKHIAILEQYTKDKNTLVEGYIHKDGAVKVLVPPEQIDFNSFTTYDTLVVIENILMYLDEDFDIEDEILLHTKNCPYCTKWYKDSCTGCPMERENNSCIKKEYGTFRTVTKYLNDNICSSKEARCLNLELHCLAEKLLKDLQKVTK